MPGSIFHCNFFFTSGEKYQQLFSKMRLKTTWKIIVKQACTVFSLISDLFMATSHELNSVKLFYSLQIFPVGFYCSSLLNMWIFFYSAVWSYSRAVILKVPWSPKVKQKWLSQSLDLNLVEMLWRVAHTGNVSNLTEIKKNKKIKVGQTSSTAMYKTN